MSMDPRLARFGPFEYRLHNGVLEWRVPGGGWLFDPNPPEAYAAVAELKNHPTIDDEPTAPSPPAPPL